MLTPDDEVNLVTALLTVGFMILLWILVKVF